ncbi:hypothetical protein SAMN04488094_1152 [Tropicimonas isoalkanivorans]|uniref:Uncharacterized protein n=1 Tax=Tropicimonas isoalkanivorans TaxID=441112 RepID=A0A1I1PGM8_9RHOB|nr:hypothetical protein SAMN04488094_1152 [Tropicimonas isoalkanivorans]
MIHGANGTKQAGKRGIMEQSARSFYAYESGPYTASRNTSERASTVASASSVSNSHLLPDLAVPTSPDRFPRTALTNAVNGFAGTYGLVAVVCTVVLLMVAV